MNFCNLEFFKQNLNVWLCNFFFAGLKDRIINYEHKEEVYFPIKKLFIILPKSMYSPSVLDEDGSLERPEVSFK